MDWEKIKNVGWAGWLALIATILLFGSLTWLAIEYHKWWEITLGILAGVAVIALIIVFAVSRYLSLRDEVEVWKHVAEGRLPAAAPVAKKLTPTNFGDKIRAVIAIIVIMGGGTTIWHMWHVDSIKINNQVLDPSIIITPVLSLIAGVVGYYFGSKGTERAFQAVDDVHALKANALAKAQGHLDELEKTLGLGTRSQVSADRDPAAAIAKARDALRGL